MWIQLSAHGSPFYVRFALAQALRRRVAAIGLIGRQHVNLRPRQQSAASPSDSGSLDAAQRLLRSDHSLPEAQIRRNVADLMDSLGLEPLVEHRTPAGPADIFLPRRRVFIETKAAGLADDPHKPQAGRDDETPFQQVERYLLAARDDELSRLPLDDEPDLDWTGIVTDGRVWHAWRFAHRHEIRDQPPLLENFRPATPDDLLKHVVPVVSVAPVGKPWIPSDPVPLFADALTELRDIFQQMPADHILRARRTKMSLWLDMLRGSGMAPDMPEQQTRLYTAHCFLVALARGVVHTLLKPDVPPDPRTLLGSGFAAWVIELEEGRAWAEALLVRIHGYEWSRTAGDVLRPLYEQFVDASDRRDFGEVYTPDWLAEMMTIEILDEDWCNQAVGMALAELRGRGNTSGIGVLDPTCGSGTFLFHAARRILSCQAMQGLPPVQQADAVCHLVHGIDIHPVAVEFSRATLLRALPAAPPAGGRAMSIYQGDALMLRQLDQRDRQSGLFEPSEEEILIRTPGAREIFLPRAFTELPDFSELLRRMVDTAAEGAALPADIAAAPKSESDRDKVANCHDVLAETIREEGNSVWTWYITNILGPERLARRKIDRIVANPPWVKLANIQARQRKRALERLAGKNQQGAHLDLWVGGKQASNFDIAKLFIRRCRERYLAEPASNPAAWVAKASAIKAGHWRKFRDWHKSLLACALDFSKAQVFGGGDARRSCVLFENRAPEFQQNDTPLLTAERLDEPPDASLSWTSAQELLRFVVPRTFPIQPSDYPPNQWRTGCRLAPKVLVMATSVKEGPRGSSTVTTDRSAQPSWIAVRPRTGDVPARWVKHTLSSSQLLPFVTASPGFAIIPCDEDGRLLDLTAARICRFWADLDDIYRERRGIGSNTPENLLERINYGKGLSTQLALLGIQERKHLVVYPASGDIMRATRIQTGNIVLDDKIYYRIATSTAEARYLVALLNAPCLNDAFVRSRRSGRDFHKNPWRAVPIPRYDASDPNHRKLAKLAQQAEKIAEAMELPSGQVAASRRIRERLASDGITSEIDKLARSLLPDQVT